jgi:hypothetical protein
MSSSRTGRRLFSAIAVLLAAILVLYLTRREPQWSVVVRADRTETAPWTPVRLTAVLTGAPADTTRWRFKWSADDGPIASSGDTAVWRSGNVGDHRLELRVTSPAGTEHVAVLDLPVILGPIVAEGLGAAAPPPPTPTSLGSAIQITNVEVEKSEVCQGEPSIVKATANVEGSDRDLVMVIDGQRGNQVPFMRLAGQPGLHRVRVVVFDRRKGHTGESQETDAFITLKDCYQEDAMALLATKAPPTPDEYTLKAVFANVENLQKMGADVTVPSDPRATAFRWSFGDGQTLVSREMTVNHVFPHEVDRPDKREQTYLVTLEALDSAERVLSRANTSVTLTSMFNELKDRFSKLELHAEYVTLPMHEEGKYTQDVTLVDPDPKETANLTGLSLELRDCQGASVETREVSPGTFFPSNSIPPRGRLSGRMVLTDGDMKGRCFVHVSVAGISEPSRYQVEGGYLMTIGSPVGTKPIHDPAQVAALDLARRLLGNKQLVTPEDIQQLEDQGKLPPGLFTGVGGPSSLPSPSASFPQRSDRPRSSGLPR